MTDTIESNLCKFIVNDLEWEGSTDDLVGPSPVSLPEALDSEELLEMVTYIEDEYGVAIDDAEIVRENFETLKDVVRLVESKLGEGTLRADTGP